MTGVEMFSRTLFMINASGELFYIFPLSKLYFHFAGSCLLIFLQ
jgi:hypothetical protein